MGNKCYNSNYKYKEFCIACGDRESIPRSIYCTTCASNKCMVCTIELINKVKLCKTCSVLTKKCYICNLNSIANTITLTCTSCEVR
jgi:hypothetical protein